MGLVLEPSMSLDEILTVIVEKTTNLMDAERSTLFLKQPDGRLVSRILQGSGIHEIRLSPGQGIAGWSALHGLPLLVNNVQADDRFDAAWDQKFGFRTREVICRPILDRGGQVVGAIEVLNKCTQWGFDEGDLEGLSLIAEQIFLNIENAKLMLDLLEKNRDLFEARQHLDRKNVEVGLLLALERSVSESADLESLCAAILSQAKQAASAAACVLYLEDSAGAELRWIAGDNPEMKSIRCDECAGGLLGWVSREGESLHLAGPAADPRYSPDQHAHVGMPLCNLAAYPLRTPHESGIRGALAVENKMGGTDFEDDDLFFMKLAGERIAQAIEQFRSRDALERDRRLATVGRLMAGVLHDIRSPMSVISGYAELLGQAAPGPESDDYLKRMNNAVRRITAMAEEIIAFSKGEREILFTKIALETMMEAFLKDIRPSLTKRGIEVSLCLRTGGTVVLDQDKMLRVFHNIVTNAAESIVGKGSIVIETDRVDSQTVFRFTDTGPGIPEKIRGSLFQSFVTAGKKQGTGLGLAVAKEIVEAHRGTIRFTTSIGRGTTFVISIPDR
jgi:signal transduction histidine kinase